MKTVVIISDSMAFPREDTQLSQTYLAQLQKATEYDFFLIGIGGGDIRLILDQFRRIRNHADIIILNFGICDAIPRALNNLEEFVISHIPIKLPAKMNTFLRKVRRISRTSSINFRKLNYSILEIQSEFEYNFPNILNSLIVLAINPIPQIIEKSHPGATRKVLLYDEILNTTLNKYYLDTNLDVLNDLNSDGIHLNIFGHEKVFKKIMSVIDDHKN
jgi:lysophospholipase L1-like esterase